jgi:cell division protein FtsW
VLLAILVRISHAARRPIVTKPPTPPIAVASTEVIEKV